ncbi:hypothetical protein C8Q80DRAFT_534547 [Daedaleopsis nitida]|nr:hypothetical protein C8Q80DRAFT_534547 [Daedaleopsis nitida]
MGVFVYVCTSEIPGTRSCVALETLTLHLLGLEPQKPTLDPREAGTDGREGAKAYAMIVSSASTAPRELTLVLWHAESLGDFELLAPHRLLGHAGPGALYGARESRVHVETPSAIRGLHSCSGEARSHGQRRCAVRALKTASFSLSVFFRVTIPQVPRERACHSIILLLWMYRSFRPLNLNTHQHGRYAVLSVQCSSSTL